MRVLTEHQRQSVEFFHSAIERMYQEGLGIHDILFWFQNFMAERLDGYGLKIYIGSESNKEEVDA